MRDIDRELPRLIVRRGRRELRRARSVVGPPGAIRTYLGTNTVRKLQLGAGTTVLPGWLNTDRDPETAETVYLDTTRRFPVPDSSFDYVFSEHQIEHLSYTNGLFMLRECFRVLRAGGRIRVATPDLRVIAGLADLHLSAEQREYVRWVITTFTPEAPGELPAFVINNAFLSWGHRFLYDEATLADALSRSGFTDVRRCVMGESQDESLRGLEAHGVAHGNEAMTRFETMVLEAVKSTGQNPLPDRRSSISR